MPYVGVILAGVQSFFLLLNNFVASPFKIIGPTGADGVMHWVTQPRGARTESAAAVSGDDHSSADAVFGIHRIHDSVCVCAGGAIGKISRRKMDSSDAALDDDRVGISEHRNFAGRALGVCGAGLGRILGMGSGGKRVAAAVAYGNCVSAFRDDAREARDDESVERVAGVHSRSGYAFSGRF